MGLGRAVGGGAAPGPRGDAVNLTIDEEWEQLRELNTHSAGIDLTHDEPPAPAAAAEPAARHVDLTDVTPLNLPSEARKLCAIFPDLRPAHILAVLMEFSEMCIAVVSPR